MPKAEWALTVKLRFPRLQSAQRPRPAERQHLGGRGIAHPQATTRARPAALESPQLELRKLMEQEGNARAAANGNAR